MSNRLDRIEQIDFISFSQNFSYPELRTVDDRFLKNLNHSCAPYILFQKKDQKTVRHSATYIYPIYMCHVRSFPFMLATGTMARQ